MTPRPGRSTFRLRNGQVVTRREGHLLPAMEGWKLDPAMQAFMCPDCGSWGVTVEFLLTLDPARRDEANAKVEEHPCLRLYWLGASP